MIGQKFLEWWVAARANTHPIDFQKSQSYQTCQVLET